MFGSLIQRLLQEGTLHSLANNPLAAWGTRNRRYLGQTILPEVLVSKNEFLNLRMRFRTTVANGAVRYSPVQKKKSVSGQAQMIQLGDSDVGSDFTSEDYDNLRLLLESSGDVSKVSMPQMATLVDWINKALILPLVEHNEVNRWAALANASITVTGDNGYSTTISYDNPTGHRVNAGGEWANNSYDAYLDMMTGASILEAKGMKVSRIIWSGQAKNKFSSNTKVKERVGRISVASGVVTGTPGRISTAALSELFSDDDLPTPETYDLLYNTDTGSDYFLARNKVIFLGYVDQEATIDLGDNDPMIVENIPGRLCMGVPAGASSPGRVLNLEAKTNKPPRIEGEGWQTSLPVIDVPEAIAVLTLASDTFTSAPTIETI